MRNKYSVLLVIIVLGTSSMIIALIGIFIFQVDCVEISGSPFIRSKGLSFNKGKRYLLEAKEINITEGTTSGSLDFIIYNVSLVRTIEIDIFFENSTKNNIIFIGWFNVPYTGEYYLQYSSSTWNIQEGKLIFKIKEPLIQYYLGIDDIHIFTIGFVTTITGTIIPIFSGSKKENEKTN